MIKMNNMMFIIYSSLLLLVILLKSSSLFALSASIIGIDMGSVFTKVSIVQPGRLFDIVLSPDSKRKYHTSMGVYQNERVYGSDAFGLFTKKPENSIWRAKNILGHGVNDQPVTLLKNYLFDNEIVSSSDSSTRINAEADGTGSPFIKIANGSDDQDIFAAEEVVAMLIQHARENAERHSSSTGINNVVLTIPSFYTPFERQALLDAVEIAGMNTLSLIDENLAAGIQFAVDRTFKEEPEIYIIYNMGAGSTQVTIFQITGKDASSKSHVRQVRVLSKTWEASFGSEDFI